MTAPAPAQPPLQSQTGGGVGSASDLGQSSSALAGTTCIELALEGERLCKSGDPKNGVRFFEEARKVGTTDSHTLSAIYSQLGNAYFALGDYQKALECHKLDVEITQKVNDEVAEAKACGNLGNVYKMFGKFDEAAVYCRRYLNICQKLNDREGEARALYNLANVYHTQGKRLISSCDQEFGELSRDIKSSLERAVEYYEKTLKVVTDLNDSTTMGKSYGNLGNTHYLLGNFSLAVEYHKKRLDLAQSIGDKLGERRALLNLGNANVFLGDFHGAIKSYSATLKMAQESGDKNTEAHACYSLANSYTFLRDYKSAVKYHLKYLELIKDSDDKLGEGRAYWSLVNLYLMLHNPENALIFARKHHEVAELLNDKAGLASAKLNIQELEDILNQKKNVPISGLAHNDDDNISEGQDNIDNAANQTIRTNRIQQTSETTIKKHPLHKQHSTQVASSGDQSLGNCPSCQHEQVSGKPFAPDSINAFRLTLDKRQEQEQRRFKKQLNLNLTGDIDGLNARRRNRQQQETHHHHHHHHREHPRGGPVRSNSSERLFDMIAHFQSGRIDDQRCEILKKPNLNNAANPRGIHGLLSSSKKKSTQLGSNNDNNNFNNKENNFAGDGDDNEFKNDSSSTTRSSQPSINSNPLSAAASVIKATYRKASLVANPMISSSFAGGQPPNLSMDDKHHRSSISSPQQNALQHQHQRRPDPEHREQLFDLIAGAQRQRMDEQRASLPTLTLPNGLGSAHKGMIPTPKRHHQPSSYGHPKPEPIQEPSADIAFSGPGSGSDARQLMNVREKSNSIVVPAQFRDDPPRSSGSSTASGSLASTGRQAKITKQSQTFDIGTAPVPKVTGDVKDDAKFLDNLMKYQSTRFNDQRSEFPRASSKTSQLSQSTSLGKEDNSQADNFFNLIVRFQSDRIEDQRSAPP